MNRHIATPNIPLKNILMAKTNVSHIHINGLTNTHSAKMLLNQFTGLSNGFPNSVIISSLVICYCFELL